MHVLPLPLILSFWTMIAQAQSPAQLLSDDKPEIRAQQVSIATEDGGLIYADLYGNSDQSVVLAHGGRFTKESWRPQAQSLVKASFQVLAFDFRSCW